MINNHVCLAEVVMTDGFLEAGRGIDGGQVEVGAAVFQNGENGVGVWFATALSGLRKEPLFWRWMLLACPEVEKVKREEY